MENEAEKHLLLFSGSYMASVDFVAMKRRCKMNRHTNSLRVRISDTLEAEDSSEIPRYVLEMVKIHINRLFATRYTV